MRAAQHRAEGSRLPGDCLSILVQEGFGTRRPCLESRSWTGRSVSARWNLRPYTIGPAHIQRILQVCAEDIFRQEMCCCLTRRLRMIVHAWLTVVTSCIV